MLRILNFDNLQRHYILLLLCKAPDWDQTGHEHTENKDKVWRGGVPMGSHFSGVEGHHGIWGVTVVCSFPSLLLPLFFSSVHLHHLLFLLWLDGHLAPIGGHGHFTADFLDQVWNKNMHKEKSVNANKRQYWTLLNMYNVQYTYTTAVMLTDLLTEEALKLTFFTLVEHLEHQQLWVWFRTQNHH